MAKRKKGSNNMSKIELTISTEYVPNWTIVDAVRELFQNALDQEIQCPGNTMSWEYDRTTETLTISNKTSKLTANSLLLGSTTKATDSSTIGQFGEGYKIATLVLLRNDKKVTFYNYGAREVWRPRFVQSRRFGTKVLTFFTEGGFWKSVPSDDLIIEVEGITADDYATIKESNLYLRDDYSIIESTELGDVIDLQGKVFVNGLFVCDYPPYTYGYNFKPGVLELDRDRKLATDFDLRWKASSLWVKSKAETALIIEMIAQDKADVAYLGNMYGEHNWKDIALAAFLDKYGPEAVPVATQEELENMPAGYKGVIVPQSYNDLIRRSLQFVAPVVDTDDEDLVERLHRWLKDLQESHGITLSDDELDEFNDILDQI